MIMPFHPEDPLSTAERPQETQGTPDLDVSPYDEQLYLPDKRRTRGIALCLSGGGFRAALFHLGAVRRLNELGILSKVETVSSVSGGSIISAYLAEHVIRELGHWPAPGEIIDEATWHRIEEPFLRFTGRNLRTGPLLKRLWPPWNLLFNPGAAAEALVERYRRGVTSLTLPELPERPRFIFCATELAYGVNWIFSRSQVGDYRVGYMSPSPDWPVARAVAASSCFPPVFDPMHVPPDFNPRSRSGLQVGRAGSDGAQAPRSHGHPLLLSDAGVYDNLGLEPVWKTHRVVLVSDGGATFDPEWNKGLLWRSARTLAIMGNQSRALRKRWLISSLVARERDTHHTNPYALQGVYWGIGSPASRYRRKGQPPMPGYSDALVREVISKVRTDMDAFSEAERCVLENHGYLLADAAVRRYAAYLIEWAFAPLSVPYPEWYGRKDTERKVKDALRNSGKVRLLGRW